jgi:hypothetical protein
MGVAVVDEVKVAVLSEVELAVPFGLFGPETLVHTHQHV